MIEFAVLAIFCALLLWCVVFGFSILYALSAAELKHGFTMVKYFHQKRKGEINNVNAKKSKTS